MYVIDVFGRRWHMPPHQLCDVCRQPNNCGECNHQKLSDAEVTELGGVLPVGPTVCDLGIEDAKSKEQVHEDMVVSMAEKLRQLFEILPPEERVDASETLIDTLLNVVSRGNSAYAVGVLERIKFNILRLVACGRSEEDIDEKGEADEGSNTL